MFCRGSVWRRGWAGSGKPLSTLLGFQDGCPGRRRHRNTALCCPRVAFLGTSPRKPVSANLSKGYPGRCTSPIWMARLTLHCLLAQSSPGPGSSWGLAVTLIRGRPRVEGLWSQISHPGALFWRCHYVARRMVVGAPRGVPVCFLVSRLSPAPTSAEWPAGRVGSQPQCLQGKEGWERASLTLRQVLPPLYLALPEHSSEWAELRPSCPFGTGSGQAPPQPLPILIFPTRRPPLLNPQPLRHHS